MKQKTLDLTLARIASEPYRKANNHKIPFILHLAAYVIIIFVIAYIAGSSYIAKANAKPEPTPQALSYVICDVVKAKDTKYDGTVLTVLMQDGSLQYFSIDETPESEIREVTFSTTDLDDFRKYKIVSLR